MASDSSTTNNKTTATAAASRTTGNGFDALADRSLRDVAGDAGAAVREFFHHTSDQASDLRRNAEDKISQHPMRAVALAALGGLALGALLRR